jgi:RNA-directed DNA polymerase
MFPALISSGNANNGSNAGAFYANTNNTASNTNTNIGSHLSNNNWKHIPCHLAKNININSVLVTHSEDSENRLAHLKRLGNLYDTNCTIERLREAYINAKKGKTKSYGVKQFEKDVDGNLQKLQQSLFNLSFKTSTYSTFTLNEYGKDRLISRLPFYPDRITHHWLMLMLEPIWNNIFVRDTYACIKTRGIHDGLKRLKEFLKDKENTTYCLKIDVRKFYPSIDHTILKGIIRKKIKDNKLLFLLDEIIDSAPGVPIGNYLSQYFANLYLAYFDHYMKEVQQVRYYQRYADDIVILHNDKAYLHSLLVNISDYMETDLKLHVKDNYQVFPVKKRGIDYLGYKTYHTHSLIRKSIKQRMFKRLKQITPDNFKLKTAAYNGWLNHANAHNLRLKYYSMISKRFSDMGIKIDIDSMQGEKIKISKLLGKEITVKNFKLTDSKFENAKHCLSIQIELAGENKVIFTGSQYLLKQIEQVGKDNFPFETVIENINDTYQFT